MASFGGIGMGRGRGILNLQPSSSTQKPASVSNGYSSKPAPVSDDLWDDADTVTTGVSNRSTGNSNTWNDSSNNNSWGGGGGDSSYNQRSSGGGRGGGKCFKCNKEGHMSRECPEAGGSNNNCFNCNQPGHRSSDCTEPRKPRGGGGGGGQTCFNCNQEGHRSNECPEPRKPRGGGGGGGQTCFNCNQEGHRSNECSEPKKGMDCFNCGQPGHRSSDCTEPRKPRAGGGGACFKCNEEGHMSRECPNPDTRPPRTCRKCGEEGHMSRECPSAESGGGDRSNKCFKCQEEGHMSRECPNSDASSTACFRCKEEGHVSRDCPNPDTREGMEGKPKASTYIPPEIEESDLFNTNNPMGINFSRYDAIEVNVSSNNCPKPIKTFNEANFRPLLNTNIEKAKYTTPTPVQKYTIPIMNAKRDLMACAQTGSGKTAAFLLPMINTMFIAEDLPGRGCLDPWAVIIAPTRELAIQIHKEAMKFSHDSVVRPALVYGGTSVVSQASKLMSGCHILVATPGRLIQFVTDGKVSFSQVKFLVLDEADRLLDMGFKSEIEKVVNHPSMPRKTDRQTLMFSATFSQDVQQLAKEFLNDYIFLKVGIVGAANADVKQVFYQVGQFEKRQKLLDLLNEHGSDKTLVFVELKRNTDFNASFLSQNDIMATSIHGDREQREREEALRDFSTGRMKVLVATAVAARGLDIKGVRHVINFDLPKDIDEYVHRIGRTGRVGNTGLATSFYDPEKDSGIAGDLLKILADAQQEIPTWLEEASRSGGGYGGGGRRFQNRDIRGGSSETTTMGGMDDDWGSGGGNAPAGNASVPVEDDGWD